MASSTHHDHNSRFALHEDDTADQQEEHQSIRSDLLTEIPDSQPDPYLPAEIPDSQPDTVYHKDLPFGELDYSELLSQLPAPDQDDLGPTDAQAFDLGDYDLREEESVSLSEYDLSDQENIDPRAHRLDGSNQEGIYDSVNDEAATSSSSSSTSSSTRTEIIPGGTRLKARVVSVYHHPAFDCCLRLSRPHELLCYFSIIDCKYFRHHDLRARLTLNDFDYSHSIRKE